MSISKSELICDLRNYIQDELKDSYYYRNWPDGTDRRARRF